MNTNPLNPWTASKPIGPRTKSPRLTGPCLLVAAVACLEIRCATSQTFFDESRWRARVDLGGSIPQDPNLTQFGGPVSGQRMSLSAGPQFDVGVGYRVTPWLELGPELGLAAYSVNSFGPVSYPSSVLVQLPMMANLRLEYPTQGRVVPYIGAGAGGVASFLTFGQYGDNDPDGSGSDIAFAFQAFGGLDVRLRDGWSLGLVYRYLSTDRQNWNIQWWNGFRFPVSVDSIQTQSFCLMLTKSF